MHTDHNWLRIRNTILKHFNNRIFFTQHLVSLNHSVDHLQSACVRTRYQINIGCFGPSQGAKKYLKSLRFSWLRFGCLPPDTSSLALFRVSILRIRFVATTRKTAAPTITIFQFQLEAQVFSLLITTIIADSSLLTHYFYTMQSLHLDGWMRW